MLGDARNLFYEDFSDLAATNEIGTKNLVEQFLPCGKNIDRPFYDRLRLVVSILANTKTFSNRNKNISVKIDNVFRS